MYIQEIRVNEQMDGYNFSIGPTFREFIKKLFPDAHPANNIFISYDIKSNFQQQYEKIEKYIYPALLGIDNTRKLKKIGEIQVIDSQTGNILHKVNPNDKKI